MLVFCIFGEQEDWGNGTLECEELWGPSLDREGRYAERRG
jgi:hypothetical protein